MLPFRKKLLGVFILVTLVLTSVVYNGTDYSFINMIKTSPSLKKLAIIPPMPYEITVVTLYIPLGKFQKGGSGFFTNDRYTRWMGTFGWLTNKLVVFVEGEETYQLFKCQKKGFNVCALDSLVNDLFNALDKRSYLNTDFKKQIRSRHAPDKTVLVKIKREELRSFKDYDKVSQIYSSPSYPKHHPNTVNANYSLTMNAKYDAMKMAIDMGHVDTNYLAWVDIGYYRNLQDADKRPKNDSFNLQVPLDFDDTKIGFTEVGGREYLQKLSPWEYIKDNHVWVAGGFILGTIPVVKKFITSYQKAFASLLQQNMSSTDQQVIGAMYSPQMIQEQEVQMKVYSCGDGSFGLHGSDAQYFCLGYKCKEAAEMRISNASLAR